MLIYSNLVRLLGNSSMDEKITDLTVKNGARNIIVIYEYRFENGFHINENNRIYAEEFVGQMQKKYFYVNFYCAAGIKYYSTVVASLQLKLLPTINGNGYVIYEFEKDASADFVARAVDDTFKAGFRPILINICENKDIDLKNLEMLVHNGALVGMPLSFFCRKKSKKAESELIKLVRGNFVHFFYGGIIPNEEKAGKLVEEIICSNFGENSCRALFLNNLIDVISGKIIMDGLVI